MSKNKAPKCKNMMYTQQAGHLPPGIKTATDLAAHIENVLAPKEYAVILHDQDISEDGTPADISSGNAGDVMIEIPKFYYKIARVAK